MWWLLAFGSAALLGGYDSFKKISLKDNAVIPVLFLNTVFCALVFSPWLFETGFFGWAVQIFVLGKSALVLSSWIAGYAAICGHEASAAHHCGARECHQACFGAGWRHLYLWREAKPPAVGWRLAGHRRTHPKGEEPQIQGSGSWFTPHQYGASVSWFKVRIPVP